jgi:hypothetical protein
MGLLCAVHRWRGRVTEDRGGGGVVAGVGSGVGSIAQEYISRLNDDGVELGARSRTSWPVCSGVGHRDSTAPPTHHV